MDNGQEQAIAETIYGFFEEYTAKSTPGEKAAAWVFSEFLDRMQQAAYTSLVERKKLGIATLSEDTEKLVNCYLHFATSSGVYLSLPEKVQQAFEENAGAVLEAFPPRYDSPGREDGAP